MEDEGDEEEEGSELEEEGDEEEEGGSEEEADGHSDLDSDQESEDEGKVQKDEEEDGAKSKSLTKEEVKAQQEAAKAELPYTFTGEYNVKHVFFFLNIRFIKSLYFSVSFSILLVLWTSPAPESYNDLKDLLSGHTSDNQRLIVARTQKCNHPSLAVGNKLKLQVQYEAGLRLLKTCFCQSCENSVKISSCVSIETVWFSVGVHWRTGH